MAGKRITINDVAAAAGVSRQTVSRAMNAMPEITPATRERVLQVSAELGYRPSRFASNLARQKHHSLGLVVATLRNPYYTDLAADMLDVAAARGWQITIATVERSTDVEVVASLAEQVDAIVGYFEAPATELLSAARGAPIVLVERVDTTAGVHCVAVDFSQGMKDLVAQLRLRGSRQFAMIDSERAGQVYAPTPRQKAFKAAVGRGSPLFVTASESVESAAQAFAWLHREHPEVDTVVAFNDLMAMGVMQSAHALNLRIPEDVKIVGIDGISLGAVMHPPLSTLSINRKAIAGAAADIVSECLISEVQSSISRVVVPRAIWRMSA